MLCSCGESEATVRETRVEHGEIVERHLCERCAARAGLLGQGQQPPLTELISNYVLATQGKPAAKAPSGDGPACPSCGLSFEAFRRTGLIGCAGCYAAFEARLTPMLERAHGGATSHVGKVPRRALAESRGGSGGALAAAAEAIAARARRVSSLRAALERAVREERYEDAAALRDELERSLGPGGGA